MKQLTFVFALIFLFSSCAPAATTVAIPPTESSTATIIPTSTYTLTPSPTFTPTMTPTITPTPLGGGSGQIACLNCINGIFPSISLVKPDGTVVTLVSDSRIVNDLGDFLAWSKDGSKLAYFGENGTCVINVNTLDEQCLDNLYGTIAWSPDGTELAIAHGAITVFNFVTGEKRTLVEGEYYGDTYAPDWSPDGKKIVYQKKGDVYVINANGSDETLLVKNASLPKWSPDSTQIAYITGYISQPNHIIVMNANGTDKVRLTPNQSLLYQMAWSSDGKYIVYHVVVTGSLYGTFYLDLYKVEVATQKVSSLTKTHNVLRYTISPDGSAIAFTLEPKGAEKCNKSFVMNMDGMILSEWKDIPCLGKVGPWRPTSNLGESVSLTLPTKGQSWEFEIDGDTQGWKDIQNINQLQVSNGYLKIEAVGGISWMRSPLFALDANAFSKIEIRMKIEANSPIWLGFITSTDLIYDAPKTNGFDAIGDGQFHNYIIDMSKFVTWKGIIRQIQFKPVEKRTSIEIDYIHILP